MTTAAYHRNGAPCTPAQFYAIACDPRRSVVVEACAGAGKTWVLVSRILRALLAGSAPHEILAITFTKKAAGEMRQRLLEWLQDFARPQPENAAKGKPAETDADWAARLDQELIARGINPQRMPDAREQLQNLYAALLGQGRPVEIRTFHSWFAALLRAAPLQVLQDLGLPASYELLEDDADAVAEVWRPFLRQVAADASLQADYAALVGAMGRHQAHKALEGALERRVEFLLADAAGSVAPAVEPFGVVYPRMAGVAQPSDWLLQRAAGRALLEDAARALLPAAKTFAACGQQLLDALAAGGFDQVQQALLTQKNEPRKFSEKVAGLPDVRAAQNELLAVLAAEQQHQAWQHQQRMARLTRALVACFADLKRERGWVDMNDIERAALTLLADHELSAWVQERLDARVRHLLIDEFQDTNPLQWQALRAWLAGYAGSGGGQQAPSVFIVGDPKQSIYRFRRADPTIFAAAQDFVVQALGGERLATDHTRRNAPAVLAGVNTVMAQAQGDGQYQGFRAHSTESLDAGTIEALPLIPRAKVARDAGDDAPEWRDTLTQPRQEAEETLRTLECRQAARWIAARIAEGIAPKNLMVLARRREPLSVLQTELRHLGIACEQPEKQVLGQQPAVQDVLALVDALLSPGNDLQLARALKSPLFGLADEDLTRLALAVRAAGDPRPSWLDVLPKAELSAHSSQALHADLMQCRQWLLSLPPHDALQAIYVQRDALARFAAAAPVPEREHVLAQLRALLHAALTVQGGRFVSAYQWLRAMRRERIPVPRHAAPEAVQLLTVHGAKGLEADEVLLLDSASGLPVRGDPAVLIDWPAEQSAPQRLAFLANGNQPAPSLAGLAASETAAGAREELNALYVAMTRARRRLVLSGVEPHRPPASSWWQRIEPLAQALELPDAAQSTQSPDQTFTLPVLPPFPPGEGGGEGLALDPVPVVEDKNKLAAFDEQAVEATKTEADTDSETSRIGQAMHWLLEHAGDTPTGWLPQRTAQAQRRFALDAGQMARAQTMARAILTGEAAWAWSADEVLEALDEAELIHQGQRLRIDRLVRRRAGAHGPEAWWVLDYKSAAHPERDEVLVAQLERYRAAVERAHPGQVVRVMFLSGTGRIVTTAPEPIRSA